MARPSTARTRACGPPAR